MSNFITADSFGSDCPANWEEIAAFLNTIISERGIEDDHDAVNELWEEYWTTGIPGSPIPIVQGFAAALDGIEELPRLDAMDPDENLSWCKPYTDDSGKYWAVVANGKAVSLRTPTGDYPDYSRSVIIRTDELRNFAKAVNPDYDDYEGWSDLHIALERMKETGCRSCPWRFECESVDAGTDE